MRRDALPKFSADPLDWCLFYLMGNPHGPLYFDYRMLFELLEDYLSRSSKEEKARLDELLCMQFSDITTMHENFSMLQSRRPRGLRRNMAKGESFVSAKALAWMQKDPCYWSVADDSEAKHLHRIGRALQIFVASPTPSGVRDERWLSQDHEQHRLLGNFWSMCVIPLHPLPKTECFT